MSTKKVVNLNLSKLLEQLTLLKNMSQRQLERLEYSNDFTERSKRTIKRRLTRQINECSALLNTLSNDTNKPKIKKLVTTRQPKAKI